MFHVREGRKSKGFDKSKDGFRYRCFNRSRVDAPQRDESYLETGIACEGGLILVLKPYPMMTSHLQVWTTEEFQALWLFHVSREPRFVKVREV